MAVAGTQKESGITMTMQTQTSATVVCGCAEGEIPVQLYVFLIKIHRYSQLHGGPLSRIYHVLVRANQNVRVLKRTALAKGRAA